MPFPKYGRRAVPTRVLHTQLHSYLIKSSAVILLALAAWSLVNQLIHHIDAQGTLHHNPTAICCPLPATSSTARDNGPLTDTADPCSTMCQDDASQSSTSSYDDDSDDGEMSSDDEDWCSSQASSESDQIRTDLDAESEAQGDHRKRHRKGKAAEEAGDIELCPPFSLT